MGYFFYAYLFFNRIFFVASDENRFHPVFIQVAIVCVAAAVCLAARRAPCRFELSPSVRMCAIVFSLCASGVVLDYCGLRMSLGACQAFACFLFGAGFVLYALVWARVYERLRLPFILVALAGALVASTLARALTYTGDIHGGVIPAALLLVILGVSLASARLCWVACVKADAATPQGGEERRCDFLASSSSRPLPLCALDADLFSRIKTPLFALGCVGFGTGLAWGEAAATQYDVGLSLAASLAVLIVALFVSRIQGSDPKGYSVFYGVAFPLSTLLLLASLLAGASHAHAVFGLLLGFSYYFAFAFLELSSMAALVSIAQANGVASTIAVSMKFIAYGAGTVLGRLTFVGVGAASVEALLCLVLVAYLAYVIFVLARNQMEDTRASAVSALEAVGESLGERFGLTARERDVLVCLLEGRTYEGAGRALFVSASTVKTHARHLYEKMGVKNRDELIEFIFGSKKSRKG